MAPQSAERKMSPSPSSARPVPAASELRLMSATPPKPSAQPRTLRAPSLSYLNTRAAKRMERKVELALMTELVVPSALESPR